MTFRQKIWIKFLKAVFGTCKEATYLLSKKDCTELSLIEAIKLKKHLIKCQYCNMYIHEQEVISHTCEAMKHNVEETKYLYTLSPEQTERFKKIIEKEQ